MALKGKSTEEIIGFLRKAEMPIAQRETAGKICRSAGISEETYYKWRQAPALFVRDFQPFPAPDAVDPLYANIPARLVQEPPSVAANPASGLCLG
jgi:hypothetical protein